MNNSTFVTKGGIKIEKSITPLKADQALNKIFQYIDIKKGALFVSNYEVPDRYSRWDLGFVHPALELITRGQNFEINALNLNGELLVKIIAPSLQKHPHIESLKYEPQYSDEVRIVGAVKQRPDFFFEEQRSRQPSVFSVVRKIFELFYSDDPYLGLYGAFGYDLVYQFENITPKLKRDSDQADCHLFLPVELVIVDRQKEEAYKIEYHIDTPSGMTESWWNTGIEFPIVSSKRNGKIKCDHAAGDFEKKVLKIKEGCRRGDFYEVVLSQSFSTTFSEKPSTLFNRICDQNPSPYSFLINLGNEQLVGASPEMYVRVKGNRFETSPISGTVPSGNDPMETAEKIKELISSEKEESELTMCTDVDRNDMARVCEPGSVRLIGRRLLERYSRLIHTVDHLEGILSKENDAIDAILSHMWACTVTGSPKPKAMQTIENLENSPRGWYSGCIGFLWFNGYVSTGMTLRTVHLKNGQATVRAGATLLYDSDPSREEKETHIKASAFLEATLGGEKDKAVKFNIGKTGKNKTVLFVDNEDSFVHVLASYVKQTGAKVVTIRSGFPKKMLDEIKPDLVFISPGPGVPSDQNVPKLVGETLLREIPIFGVCLGHQGIAEYFGGKLMLLKHPFHGKPDEIFHNGESFYSDLPNPFMAGRYHSLYVDADSLPNCLEVDAKNEDGIIMGLRHKKLPVASVQFHPESILTLKGNTGIKMISNMVLELTGS